MMGQADISQGSIEPVAADRFIALEIFQLGGPFPEKLAHVKAVGIIEEKADEHGIMPLFQGVDLIGHKRRGQEEKEEEG
jgi:hypothetical protein